MLSITDSKEIFPEFKFWKNIITSINKTESVILYPGENSVNLLFSRDNFPFIFSGRIILAENILKDIFSGNIGKDTYGFRVLAYLYENKKSIEVNLKDLRTVALTLKKNAVSVEITEGGVIYKFLNKDDSNLVDEIVFKFIDIEDPKYDIDITKINLITEQLKYKISLDVTFLDGDILKIFLNSDNTLTTNRTIEKLFEYPSQKIFSLINTESAVISFSNKINNEQRYVSLTSITDLLELSQTFLVI